jgi:hypothetical protein
MEEDVDVLEGELIESYTQELTLHPAQSVVFESLMVKHSVRYAVACCSRGFGKSYLATAVAMAAIHELMDLPDSVPNKRVYIVAPTHDQVKDIYMPILLHEYYVEDYAVKVLQDTGKITFPGNVDLILLSYESIERIRGKGAYLFILDEVSSCTKGIDPAKAWEGIVQPAMVTRWSKQAQRRYNALSPSRALFISTPKGYNYFYELFNLQEKDAEWGSWLFDYTHSPYLDPEEIEKLRDKLDPVEFASEYLASFKESGNSVFYCFDRKLHIESTIQPFQVSEDDPTDEKQNEIVYCAIDFNVGLQCTSIGAVRNGQIEWIDEMKGHPDTETLAIALKARYPNHRIQAYPDPSGRSRKTSAPVGRTDFSILESYGIRCYAHQAAPSIVDSVAAVNRKLMTASGKVSMKVHPRCQGIITSLERTKWVDRNPDTATIDKSEGVEHFSDGIRYMTEMLFPIHAGTKRSKRGFGF